MLQRHLLGTSTKFGVGANRAAVASHFIQKYGCIDTRESPWYEKQHLDQKAYDSVDSEKIGVVVLDDAMQVMSLFFLSPHVLFFLLNYYFMILLSTMILEIHVP